MNFLCFLADLENNIAGINEDLKSFESRLKFASEIQSAAEVLHNLQFKINIAKGDIGACSIAAMANF